MRFLFPSKQEIRVNVIHNMRSLAKVMRHAGYSQGERRSEFRKYGAGRKLHV